jgi:hypothetical protein
MNSNNSSNNNRRKPFATGLMSLFAVLITLCLVIFAILALLTARNELALANRAADTVSARYESEYRYVVYGEVPTEPTPPETTGGMSLLDPDNLPWNNT